MGQVTGQQGLAASGWTDHQQMVSARCGQGQRCLGKGLAADRADLGGRWFGVGGRGFALACLPRVFRWAFGAPVQTFRRVTQPGHQVLQRARCKHGEIWHQSGFFRVRFGDNKRFGAV